MESRAASRCWRRSFRNMVPLLNIDLRPERISPSISQPFRVTSTFGWSYLPITTSKANANRPMPIAAALIRPAVVRPAIAEITPMKKKPMLPIPARTKEKPSFETAEAKHATTNDMATIANTRFLSASVCRWCCSQSRSDSSRRSFLSSRRSRFSLLASFSAGLSSALLSVGSAGCDSPASVISPVPQPVSFYQAQLLRDEIPQGNREPNSMQAGLMVQRSRFLFFCFH